MMSFIEIRDVRKRFGHLEVLHGITLDVEQGEVVCLLGPSGCGKTTLLRCINHLETLDAGSIRVDGRLIGYQEEGGHLRETGPARTARDRIGLGMVFQRFNLFPHLTVLDNLVLAPTRVSGRPKSEAQSEAMALLDEVGLADKADNYPSQLSGGQQQRVAIARALAMKPHAMLFDEPTSALDPELIGEVLVAMRQLAQSGMTMIVVTHELGFARGAANRVIMMDAGTIVEDTSSRSFFANPEHPRSRAFLQRLHAREEPDDVTEPELSSVAMVHESKGESK